LPKSSQLSCSSRATRPSACHLTDRIDKTATCAASVQPIPNEPSCARVAAPINLVVGRGANKKSGAAYGRRGSNEPTTMRHRYLIPHGVLEIEPKSIPHNNITQQQKWRAAVSGLPARKIAILQKKVNAFQSEQIHPKDVGDTGRPDSQSRRQPNPGCSYGG
jgi:hypothetical protein